MTDTLELRYDRGRAGRQLIGFGMATLIMLALAALGTWMIVASFVQMELAGKIIGGGFGLFFVLLAILVLVTAAEVLTRIVRWSRQSEPLVTFDERGVGGLPVVMGAVGVGQPHIAWSEIVSLRLDSHAAKGRRSNAVAQLDAGHRTGLAVKSGLDRTAGTGLGMRDGHRSIALVLVDGRIAGRDLRLPLGPESFGAVEPRIVDLARAHGVDVEVRGDLAH